MNIYEKIQKIKVKLQNQEIKMTGHNTYAGYDYFELDDFIKPLNILMEEYKLTAYPSFTCDLATLTVVNTEDPTEMITITSPMGSASLKGCHEVQNIGAVETYQRRYLYQAMFDISESDALNKTHGKPEQEPKQNTPKQAPQKKQELPFNDIEKQSNEEVVAKVLKGTKWGLDVAEAVSFKAFAKPLAELNQQQLKALIQRIEEKKNGTA